MKRAAAALVLAFLVVLAGPGVVSASAMEKPWVPPSGGDPALFEAVAAGSLDVRAGLVEVGSSVWPTETDGCVWSPSSVDVVNGQAVVRYWESQWCVDHGVTNNAQEYVFTYSGDSASWHCEDGSAVAVKPTLTWVPGTRTSTVSNVAAACGGGPVVAERTARARPNVGLKFFVNSFRVTFYAPGSVQVVCGGPGGVSSVSAQGYGNLSVACPVGMSPVSSTVDGKTYSIPGFLENPSGAAACGRGECQPVVIVGGAPCPLPAAGVPDWAALLPSISVDCEAIRSGDKSLGPTLMECQWWGPDGPSDPIMLSPADCVAYVASHIVGSSQPVDQDNFGPLKEAVDRVRRAVEAVKTAVEGVGRKIDTAAAGITQKLEAMIGTDPGIDPVPAPALPSPGVTPAPGAADQMAQKFAPWTDAITGLIGSFNAPDPGCQGAGYWIPYPVNQTIHPWDACTEPMKTVARVFRAGLTVVLVVTGAIACFRLLTAALGYHTGQGGEGGDAT